jgi:dethiobiotin synthetase
MAKGIFICGTDTGIGKTVVSAGILALLLKKGRHAGYYKPVISGVTSDRRRLLSIDPEFVRLASGLKEETENMTCFRFRRPVSPHYAARLEGQFIEITKIRNKLENLKRKYDHIIIEGCGGLAVPLTDDGYMQYDLIQDLKAPVILVAKSGLGTINHTLLTVESALSKNIPVKGIILNNYKGTDMENDNAETIRKFSKIPVLGMVPRIKDLKKNPGGILAGLFEKILTAEKIIECMGEI